jgi:hypothetical protein
VTCIVGLVDSAHGRIYMGGDSAGVGYYNLTVRRDPKVFRNGPYLLGFTSSFRMGQLLRFAFQPPTHPDGMDIERFMATTWVDAVRECLKAGGFARKNSDAEEGGTFLVGYRGRLFRIENDYQVGEALDGYDAVGCGADLALGALYASGLAQRNSAERVFWALEAAERGSAGVRGPFTLEVLEEPWPVTAAANAAGLAAAPAAPAAPAADVPALDGAQETLRVLWEAYNIA